MASATRFCQTSEIPKSRGPCAARLRAHTPAPRLQAHALALRESLRDPCHRTCEECYWTGLRQTRWARAVYAANLGREYVFPYQNIGHKSYKSDIKALCWCVYSVSGGWCGG